MANVTITFDEGTRMAVQAAYLVGRMDQKSGLVISKDQVVQKVAAFLREASEIPTDLKEPE